MYIAKLFHQVVILQIQRLIDAFLKYNLTPCISGAHWDYDPNLIPMLLQSKPLVTAV